MKTCPKCGNEVSDNAKFCPECGYAFTQKEAPASSDDYKVEKIKPRRKHSKVFPAVLLVLAAVLAALILIPKKLPGAKDAADKLLSRKPVINLEDFVLIKYDGYDGDGYVQDDYPCLDVDALQRKMDAAAPEHAGSASDIAAAVQLELTKDGQLIDGKHLNNEESVAVQMEYDSKNLDEICPQIRFVGNSKDEIVKLKVLISIDPFENYTPTIEGISPAGHVRMDTGLLNSTDSSFISKCYQDYGTLPFTFYLNGKEIADDVPVAVGDTIEMKLNENGQSALEDNGYTCSGENKSKQYTLSLADFDDGAYVSNSEEIDSTVLKDLQNTCTQHAKAYAARGGYNNTPQFVGIAIAQVKSGIDINEYSPFIAAVYEIQPNDESENKRYIIVFGPPVIEQVENHGTAEAAENPGKTIQTFDRDEDAFSENTYWSVDETRMKFMALIDRYTFSMSDPLKEKLNWTEN